MARFRPFLDEHTASATDPLLFGRPVASRYHTLRYCFDHFLSTGGRTVVELGTIRSFVHGGLPGCNSDDVAYWEPGHPESWDWGAGCFSLLAAMCLSEVGPEIHTVDLVATHIERCKVVTSAYKHLFQYHISSSVEFLRRMEPGSVDLLYLDTGDMWPIEPTALNQLQEVKVLCKRRLLSPRGLVLIDDVRNATPPRMGERNLLGKAKYSLEYLRSHGFEVVLDEYQVVLAQSTEPTRRSRPPLVWLKGRAP
ncbi:MAG TPA: hypothetical protein VME46_09205 [Acidimicrobiales bacterium]|nr:hypothetical protein [Acidimicrobiales bacterium]